MKLRISFLLLLLCVSALADNVNVTNPTTNPIPVNVVAGGSAPTPVARTPSVAVAIVSGSVTAGARSVSIAPSSDFAGTILGTTITGTTNGGSFTWTAGQNDTLAAIAYTRTAGSLTILQVR